MSKTKRYAKGFFKASKFMYLFVVSILITGFFLGVQYQKNQKSSSSTFNTPEGVVEYETPIQQTKAEQSEDIVLDNSNDSSEVEKATLTSTDGWKEVTFDEISFMLPSQAEGKVHNYPDTCQKGFDRCYRINNHVPDSSPWDVEIAYKKYNGGSRRVEAGLEGNYTYKELDFGTRQGLEATFVCQTSACTPYRVVIFVVGNDLVLLRDVVYIDKTKGDGTENNPWGSSLESPVTNTIISTVK